MTVLGAIFVSAAFVALAVRRDLYVLVLSAAAAFPTSAAVVIGGEYAISPFYLLGLPLIATAARGRRLDGPGRHPLILFAAWTALVTLSAPMLYDRVRVLTPDAGIEAGLAHPQMLQYTASQIGQLGYLAIGLAVVFTAARHGPWHVLPAPGLALAVLLALSELISVSAGVPWPHDFFDTAAVTYLDSEYLGQVRIRGTFAEASLLGEVSVASLAYFSALAASGLAMPRVASAGLAAASLVVAIASASGTAAAALTATAALGLIVAVGQLRRHGRASIVVVGVPVLGALGILYGARTYNAAATLVEGKLTSDSGMARHASNDFSMQVLTDSFGMGVGIGAHRPSSLLFLLLACTGVIGTVLFSLAVWRIGMAARGPAAVALVAALAAKVAGAADLAAPYWVMLLATCASVAWHAQRPAGPDPTLDSERATRTPWVSSASEA